jgi:probable F420-dependent oxidoreductase
VKLAFSPSSTTASAAELVSLTVEAEHLGYSAAWLAEVAGPEAFALAGAIAAATNEIDLGVAVVPATTRSPALLAMGAGTISSLLAGRRFDLGIGSSSALIVERWHGSQFDQPLIRVKEVVEATRALLGGERSYRGATVVVDGFRLLSPPVGPIGISIGALGPGMLRLAGEVGDGVCLNLMTTAVVPRQIAAIAAGANRGGGSLPDDFGVMARFHVALGDDVAASRDLIRHGFGPYFAQPVYNRFLTWMGYEEAAAALQAAFAAGDRAGVAKAFSDEIIDEVALVGPVGLIRERLADYESAGITTAAINLLGGDAAAIASGLRALAPVA